MSDKSGPVGRWIEIDGEPVDIRANPNLSQETQDILVKLVRAIRQWDETEHGDFDKAEFDSYLSQYMEEQ